MNIVANECVKREKKTLNSSRRIIVTASQGQAEKRRVNKSKEKESWKLGKRNSGRRHF